MRAFIALAGLLSLTVGCAFHSSRFHHSRTVEQSIETQPLTSIDLTTFNGSVDVEPHDLATVDMVIDYKGYGESQEQAISNCELLNCDISADEGRLVIRAVKPEGQRRAAVSFKLKVPVTCEVKLRTSNGKISVIELAAHVDAKTSNGTIELKRIMDDVTARTSNGTISVEGCHGAINLHTSNGPVTYAGTIVGTENEIRTSNGRVTVRLPSDGKTELATRTSNGSINCTFETQRVLDESKRAFHAIVGSGTADAPEAKLNVHTSNGSIKIEQLPADTINPVTPDGEVEETIELIL